MTKLLSNLDWKFDGSDYEISPQNNNIFFTLQGTINHLYIYFVSSMVPV
jgi:hypothetical protein